MRNELAKNRESFGSRKPGQITPAAEQSAAPKHNQRQLGGSHQESESEEGKFASLTSALLMRKKTPAQSVRWEADTSHSDQPATDVLAKKGEARPSAIAVPSPSPAHLQAARVAPSSVAEQQAAVAKAMATWKADEAKRLAAAEAEWREKSAAALAEATARSQRAEALLAEADSHAPSTGIRNQENEAELDRLREESARLRATVAECKIALSEADVAVDQARKRWQQLAAEAHAAELAQNELQRVRQELAATQTALADREAALVRQSVAEPPRPRRMNEILREPGSKGKRQHAEGGEKDLFFVRPLIAAAALGLVAAVFFYFHSQDVAQVQTVFKPAPVAAPAPAAFTPKIVGRTKAVVTQTVEVRSEPSPYASVVSSLPAGTKVAVIGEAKNWTLVGIGSDLENGKLQKAWLETSFLQRDGARLKGPPAQARRSETKAQKATAASVTASSKEREVASRAPVEPTEAVAVAPAAEPVSAPSIPEPQPDPASVVTEPSAN